MVRQEVLYCMPKTVIAGKISQTKLLAKELLHKFFSIAGFSDLLVFCLFNKLSLTDLAGDVVYKNIASGQKLFSRKQFHMSIEVHRVVSYIKTLLQ